MAKRRKSIPVYHYTCSLSGEEFKSHRQITEVDNLVSVKAYYELNPENDDRPAHIIARLTEKTDVAPTNSAWEKLVALARKQQEEKEAQEAEHSANLNTSNTKPRNNNRRRR